MKKLIVVLVSAFFATTAFAQVPDKIEKVETKAKVKAEKCVKSEIKKAGEKK